MKKKAALLQMRPEWASPEANRKQVEQLVSRAMEEAEDILVLPELWDTGFFPSEIWTVWLMWTDVSPEIFCQKWPGAIA